MEFRENRATIYASPSSILLRPSLRRVLMNIKFEQRVRVEYVNHGASYVSSVE